MPDAAIPILLNPTAGSGGARRGRERLEAELRRAGTAYTLTVTDSEEHLRRMTRTLAAERGVIAGAGGDSTFLIMINEILGAGLRARLGLIGLGSSNDIPREFGIETIAKACLALAGGRVRRIDAGSVRTAESGVLYFLGQANIGLGAVVNRFVADLARRRPRLARRQTLAGLLGIRRAFRRKDIPIALSIRAGGRCFDGPLAAAVFANTRYWASGRIIAPDARPDDGLLDACLIEARSMRRLSAIDGAAKRGRHSGRRGVTMFQAAEFEVRSERPFMIQTDGETICAVGEPRFFRQAVIRSVPAALEIFIPPA